MAAFGVYVHVPWCRQRCSYCDFAIAIPGAEGIPHKAYLEALLRELDARAKAFEGRQLASIYFGGGTPSLWDIECLTRMVHAIRQRFGAQDATLEVNLESNPTDCTSDNLRAWHQAGINRLLIGVQSTSRRDLEILGRDHSMGDGLRALRDSRGGPIPRIGADIIFGIPGAGSAGRSVDAVSALGPDHLSVYELTVEERTPLAARVARGELELEHEDRLADSYIAIHDQLTALGYEHYEVSSYARPGARAVHNSLYWTGGEYLGLGNGAASFRRTSGPGETAGGGERTSNHRSVGRYLAAAASETASEIETLSPEELATELLWLAMRTVEGASSDQWVTAVGASVLEGLLRDGLVEVRGDRAAPTPRGFLYNNQILRRISEA